jgi:hypothetical protein
LKVVKNKSNIPLSNSKLKIRFLNCFVGVFAGGAVAASFERGPAEVGQAANSLRPKVTFFPHVSAPVFSVAQVRVSRNGKIAFISDWKGELPWLPFIMDNYLNLQCMHSPEKKGDDK